nr:TPA_asm: m47.4 sORF [Murid betaherpesvirus 1]DBA07985.1 TPA_asm: m47.4 sORF [Murid betaherpesvirus 1]
MWSAASLNSSMLLDAAAVRYVACREIMRM